MPWLSQVQQDLGTGGQQFGPTEGTSMTTGVGGAAPAGSSFGRVNPYDLATAFAQHYGGMPTHQLVAGMQNGVPPTPAPGAGAWGGASGGSPINSTSPAPTATPQQAGMMNAAQPGIFNGNPANGYPGAEEGFKKALAMGPPRPPRAASGPGMTAPLPSANGVGGFAGETTGPRPGAAPSAAPQQAASTSAVTGTGSRDGSALAPDENATAARPPAQMTEDQLKQQQIVADQATAAQSAATYAASGAPSNPSAQHSMDGLPPGVTPPPMSEVDNAPQSWQVAGPNGQMVTVYADPHSVQYWRMTPAQKRAFISGNSTAPAGSTGTGAGTTGTTGTGTTATGSGVVGSVSGSGANGGVSGTVTGGVQEQPITEESKDAKANNTGIGADYLQGHDNAAIDLMFQGTYEGGAKWWDKNLWTALGANNTDNLPRLKLPNQTHGGQPYLLQLDDSDFSDQLALDPDYGIDDPGVLKLYTKAKEYAAQMAYYKSHGLDSGAAVVSTNRKLYLATKALEQYGVYYKPGGNEGTGTIDQGDRGPYDIATSVDMVPAKWGKGTAIGNLLNIGSEKITAADRLAIAEFLSNQGLTEEALREKQQAIDEAVRLGDANQNDPLVQQFLARSQQDIPETDWNQVRSSYVADQDRALHSNMDDLSANLRRRGLGAATGAGLAANTYRQAAGEQAQGLGDLSIQQSQEKQRLFQQGLGNLQTGAGVSTGLRNMTSQQIQQLLMGQAPTVNNPFEGLGNTGFNAVGAQLNLDALNQAGRTADEQANLAKWQMGLSFVSSIIGAAAG